MRFFPIEHVIIAPWQSTRYSLCSANIFRKCMLVRLLSLLLHHLGCNEQCMWSLILCEWKREKGNSYWHFFQNHATDWVGVFSRYLARITDFYLPWIKLRKYFGNIEISTVIEWSMILHSKSVFAWLHAHFRLFSFIRMNEWINHDL